MRKLELNTLYLKSCRLNTPCTILGRKLHTNHHGSTRPDAYTGVFGESEQSQMVFSSMCAIPRIFSSLSAQNLQYFRTLTYVGIVWHNSASHSPSLSRGGRRIFWSARAWSVQLPILVRGHGVLVILSCPSLCATLRRMVGASCRSHGGGDCAPARLLKAHEINEKR